MALAMKDVSTAFLRAACGLQQNTTLIPRSSGRCTKPRMEQRSTPKAWQDHLGRTGLTSGPQPLVSQPDVYRNALGTFYLVAYMNDLFFFELRQALLRPTGELVVGPKTAFNGQQLKHKAYKGECDRPCRQELEHSIGRTKRPRHAQQR